MIRRALLAAALSALAACSTFSHKPPPLAAQDDAVSFNGKLSVQARHAGKVQGGNAMFELTGTPRAGQLELSTPLGSLVARARWQPDLVLLQTAKEERHYTDLDALSTELLGEPIPVTALFSWLRGEPIAEIPSAKTDAGFEQLGWQIDLSRFADKGLIVAARSASDGQDDAVTLRAVVERPQQP